MPKETIINDLHDNTDLVEQSAVIVTLNHKVGDPHIEEIIQLGLAAKIICVKVISQNLQKENSLTYVGKGKIDEIKAAALGHGVKIIIFDDELAPRQFRALSEQLDDFEIWDRTMLILDIFERRARTKEAVLQVEVAKLKYTLPRLIGAHSYLSRTSGGGGGGGGARRGAGETQLELDRQRITSQIVKANQELESIMLSRANSRKSRKANDLKTVALVGYTNAGKSSLLNAILNKVGDNQKNVFVKDMLFATLDTATRNVKLPNNHQFLITDTIGFVERLPHHLISSFKATLEEIREASLILHVVDVSNPSLFDHINTTSQVLEELQITDIPVLYVFNKIDKYEGITLPSIQKYQGIAISAETGFGLDELIDKIDKFLFTEIIIAQYLIPYDKGDIHHQFCEKAEVTSTSYLPEGILFSAKSSPHLADLYSNYRLKL